MNADNLVEDIHYMDAARSGVVPQVIVLRMPYMVMVNYSYLVADTVSKQSVVVDPAWDMEKIEQALADTQTVLSGILLTHSHPDHIHLSKPLAEKYHCPIWMSTEEITASGFNAPQLMGIDTTPWLVGKMQIQPILTPGHTPGSTCYLIGNNLFTGDTLFAEGCGICPDKKSAYAMFASLEHLKTRLHAETRIFPGHVYGKPPGQVFAQLLNDNIYLNFKNENDFAGYRLRSGQNGLRFLDFL
jgi:hydroxyacylglutathione hydrolase